MENMTAIFKSVLEQDRAAVVICDLEHTIIYMNPVAEERYAKYGGAALLGKCLLDCHNPVSVDTIKKIVDWFKEDEGNNMIYTFHNIKENKDVYMVALRDAEKKLIGYYEKHEYRDMEDATLYDFSRSLV